MSRRRRTKAPTQVPCPCGQVARLVTGATLYPHRPDLAHKRFFRCSICDRYVGTHPNGFPMGAPADDDTRRARHRAHCAFDSIWENGWLPKGAAYEWLADQFGLTAEAAHIGFFDVARCVDLCERVAGVAAQVREGTWQGWAGADDEDDGGHEGEAGDDGWMRDADEGDR